MTLLTTTWLDEAEQRAELAAEVTLPIDQFKALLAAARRGIDLEAAGCCKADAAESALSATRERLEIAVEALKECTKQCVVSGPEHEFHHRMECLIAHSALERISAIAAKACTGGKAMESDKITP